MYEELETQSTLAYFYAKLRHFRRLFKYSNTIERFWNWLSCHFSIHRFSLHMANPIFRQSIFIYFLFFFFIWPTQNIRANIVFADIDGATTTSSFLMRWYQYLLGSLRLYFVFIFPFFGYSLFSFRHQTMAFVIVWNGINRKTVRALKRWYFGFFGLCF